MLQEQSTSIYVNHKSARGWCKWKKKLNVDSFCNCICSIFKPIDSSKTESADFQDAGNALKPARICAGICTDLGKCQTELRVCVPGSIKNNSKTYSRAIINRRRAISYCVGRPAARANGITINASHSTAGADQQQVDDDNSDPTVTDGTPGLKRCLREDCTQHNRSAVAPVRPRSENR